MIAEIIRMKTYFVVVNVSTCNVYTKVMQFHDSVWCKTNGHLFKVFVPLGHDCSKRLYINNTFALHGLPHETA